ncbi:MAG: site-specific integrase [Chitinivibrionales bacterium]|nr:site-specific integrase [Chitinivibrionales bacterium]
MSNKIKSIGENLWFLDVRLIRQGKQYRRRERVAGSMRKAETRYRQIYRDLEDSADYCAAQGSLTSFVTFGECLGYYLERKNADDRSMHYFQTLNKELGGISMADLRDVFDQFLLRLRKTVTKQSPCYSIATCNRYLAWAKASINFCIKRGKLAGENPLKSISKGREIPRDFVLNTDEQQRLISVLNDRFPYLVPIVTYIIQVPCRRTEIVNARRENYDQINQVIRISNGTTKTDEGVYKPIPPNMIEYFKSLPSDCPYLFYRIKKGTYVSIGDFRRAWKTALKRADLPTTIRPHDLRHIAATAMIANGNSERQVMQVAGWRSPMLSTYYHRDGLNAAKTVSFSQNSNASPTPLLVANVK